MKRALTIMGGLVGAIVLCFGLASRENSALNSQADERQLVHDALQATIDKNYTKSCALYHEIIAKRITVDAYETQYFEEACAKAR